MDGVRSGARRITALVGASGLLTSSFVVASVATTATSARAVVPASSVSEFQPTVPTRYGGRSISVSIDAADTNQVIVATESGGLFRSSDAGATWSHVDGFPLHRMSDVKWSANNPNLIIATTWQSGDSVNGGGVWRSTDGGTTWNRAATPAACGADMNGWGIDFEPSTNVVYTGSNCGLLMSTDGGATFSQTAIAGFTHAVVARPGSVDVCSDDGVRRYTRSGSTLTLASGPNAVTAPGGTAGGCPQVNGGMAASAHDLAGVPGDPNVLFMLRGGTSTTACTGTTAAPAGVNYLMESDDGGVTWTQIGGGCTSRAPWVVSQRLSSTQFALFYSGGLNVYHATCSYSTTPRCSGLPAVGASNVTAGHADPSQVAFDPTTNCGEFLVSDGGVGKSTDCGATFPMVAGSGAGNGGFNGLQVYEISGQVHPGSPAGSSDYVFGTQDNSIYGSSDSGATWPNVVCCEGFNFNLPRSAPSMTGRVTFVACGPCANLTANPDLSGSGGWTNPPGTVEGADVGTPYLLRPTTDTYVEWTADSAGNSQLYLTTNAGSSWTAVSGATTSQALMGHMIVTGPATDPTLFQPVCLNGCGSVAPSGALLKITGVNTPNPVTVTTIAGGLNTLGAYNDGNGSFRLQEPALGVDTNNPLHLIAADVGTNSMKQSRDGGATWTTDAQLTQLVTSNNRFTFRDLTGRLGTQAHAIYFDPTNSNRILVGTENSGVIASLDGGSSWVTLPGSTAITAVTSFFIDEVDGNILASSYGRGLWKLTIPAADLSVTKTHRPDPAVAGQDLFYDVTVSNNGPNDSGAVTVTDTLPADVSYVTNNLAAPSSCTVSSPPPGTGQTVTCQLPPIANAGTVTFTIQVLVHQDADATSGPHSITNTVSVSQLGSADPDASNNTAQDTALVQDSADLKVTKVCTPDTTIYAGQPINCTVYVDNSGPSDARAVVVDDAILSNGTFTVSNVSPALSSGTPGCTLSTISGGQQLTCRLGPGPAATTSNPGRLTMSYTLNTTEGQNINNVATARSDTPDPDTSNNKATVNLTVTSSADVSLTAGGPTSPTAGGAPVTWTFTATNNGPSTANGVVIADAVPAGVHVTAVSGTTASSCVAGVPGDASQPASCQFGSLASGATRTLSVTVTVDPGTTGVLHNDGRVSSTTFDPDLSNNLAHLDATVVVDSDLAETLVATPNPVIAGRVLTFKATTTNNGPSTATGVTLTVTLPSGVTYQGTSSTGPASCGLLTPTEFSCTLGTLTPGQTVSVFVDTLVAPSVAAGATLTGSATVSSASADSTSGNNTASTTASVIRSADLGIVLTSDANVYKPSTVIHYTFTVTNSGPSDAAGVQVAQTMPSTKIMTYVSNNGSCPAPTGTTTQTFTCALGTIPAGATVTVQLNMLIRGNKGTISSTATVSSSTPDPVSANNSSTRNVTVK